MRLGSCGHFWERIEFVELETFIPLITGSCGALVVQALWIWSERSERKAAEARYEAIAREAIECLAKIVDHDDTDKEWRRDVKQLLNTILEALT